MEKLGKIITKLRTDENLSQEKFAQRLNVTRQAVQKWENGSAYPDLDNLIGLAKCFNVSLDTLVFGTDKRLREIAVEKKLLPDYDSLHVWELFSSNLMHEYRHALEEGLDVERYEDLFRVVSKLENGDAKERLADILFGLAQNAGERSGYRYKEPSGLEQIRALRPEGERAVGAVPDRAVLRDKIAGAWLGRCCGCLLGKPIEGIRTKDLAALLKGSGNHPMRRYVVSGDVTDEIAARSAYRLKGADGYADLVPCGPADDDTNYTVLASVLVERYGRDFTSKDVAKLWADSLPKNAFCTAERVAFCNVINGYGPPKSAVYKNPYREWIGAQIRGDYFGYINPADPETAAEMAWRDGSVSHTKNGIYGEMFVAAMLADAAADDDMASIVQNGLAQIPRTSRLHEAVSGVLDDYKSMACHAACLRKIYRQFDEYDGYDWCLAIPNAMIVTAALLYGNDDFGKTVCLAVESAFDTDCNGATAGSVMGMKNGAAAIPDCWAAPIRGKLKTGIFGMDEVSLSDMTDRTLRHIRFE